MAPFASHHQFPHLSIKSLHTYISGHELLGVINRGYSGLSLGDECIIVGVVGDQQHVWGKKMWLGCGVNPWLLLAQHGDCRRAHDRA